MREDDLEMSKTGLLAEEEMGDRELEKGDSQIAEPIKTFRNKLVDGFCIVLNIASTVLLVFLNNWYLSPRLPPISPPSPNLYTHKHLLMWLSGSSKTPNSNPAKSPSPCSTSSAPHSSSTSPPARPSPSSSPSASPSSECYPSALSSPDSSSWAT